MARLLALELAAGPDFVAAVADAWDSGDAVFPLDPRLPEPERARLLAEVRPTHLHDASGMRSVPDGVEAEEGDAVVIATSGTTGTPKAAILTREALEATTRMTATALEIDAHDRWLLCLSPAHIGGFGVVARALLGGVGIDALARFDATAVTEAGRSGATLVSLVPAVVGRIDPEVFRVILLGGSAIPQRRPPNAVATYGSTETAGGVVYDGRPLEGVDIRIGPDDQIQLRSPSLLRAYRNGAAPIDADGYMATGDVGSYHDGTLEVFGRRDHVIVSGGHKIWPERVEAVLQEHPAISAVRVVGRADPEWGEIVVAEVVADSTLGLDAVRGFVKDRLPAYMAPRVVEFVASVPTTPLGKIRRTGSVDPTTS